MREEVSTTSPPRREMTPIGAANAVRRTRVFQPKLLKGQGTHSNASNEENEDKCVTIAGHSQSLGKAFTQMPQTP
jgi:hypothetical protein